MPGGPLSTQPLGHSHFACPCCGLRSCNFEVTVLSGLLCCVSDPREPLLGSRNDIKTEMWGVAVGTPAGWHQATGGWAGIEGARGLAFIRVSLCREYATKMHCFGWGWEGVRCEAEGPSARVREELGLATVWRAFSPENRQREPRRCRSLRPTSREALVPVGKPWTCAW